MPLAGSPHTPPLVMRVLSGNLRQQKEKIEGTPVFGPVPFQMQHATYHIYRVGRGISPLVIQESK